LLVFLQGKQRDLENLKNYFHHYLSFERNKELGIPCWFATENNTTIATTNPLERSNCRIHLRGRIEVDRSFFPAGVTLERAVESRVWMHVVSKKTIVFLSSSLLPSRSLFCSLAERAEQNRDKTLPGIEYCGQAPSAPLYIREVPGSNPGAA
jgi:hypothetical protein